MTALGEALEQVSGNVGVPVHGPLLHGIQQILPPEVFFICSLHCVSSFLVGKQNTVQVQGPTRCQRRHGMDRPTAGFFLRISLKKGILVLRCGRCPLCRWSVHLRRCRGTAIPLHCRILFSVFAGTRSGFGKFCFVLIQHPLSVHGL